MTEDITSQTKLIEQHLRSGQSITPMDALNLYGCFRLGARIWDLKEKGMNIVTEMVRSGKKRYAMYRLSSIDPVIVICIGLTLAYAVAIGIVAYKFYKLAKNHAAWRLGQKTKSNNQYL
jgi:hypothetical protein